MSGCLGCRGIKGIIQEMRGGKGTSFDKKLHVCGVTGMLNHIQVFIDAVTIKEAKRKARSFPQNCWMNEL